MNLGTLAFASDDSGAAGVLVFIVFCIAMYFLPSMLAWKKSDFGSVLAINFFLGWTLVGWVVALAWALKSDKPTQVIVNNAPPQSSILCSSCGKYSEASTKFCAHCGAGFARAIAR